MNETELQNGDAARPAVRSSTLLGCDLIKAERERQIAAEGYSAEHDASHTNGELAKAAACYAMGEQLKVFRGFIQDDPSCPFEPRPRVHEIWPWDQRWWKAGDRVRNLVKAGALIAAEIDRLQNNGAQHPNDSR